MAPTWGVPPRLLIITTIVSARPALPKLKARKAKLRLLECRRSTAGRSRWRQPTGPILRLKSIHSPTTCTPSSLWRASFCIDATLPCWLVLALAGSRAHWSINCLGGNPQTARSLPETGRVPHTRRCGNVNSDVGLPRVSKIADEPREFAMCRRDASSGCPWFQASPANITAPLASSLLLAELCGSAGNKLHSLTFAHSQPAAPPAASRGPSHTPRLRFPHLGWQERSVVKRPTFLFCRLAVHCDLGRGSR
jgi:hypothetical protein